MKKCIAYKRVGENKSILFHFAFVLALSSILMLTSCSSDNDDPAVEIESGVNPEAESLPAARITETIRKEEAKATVYNIEYPSIDPYGYPVTLSGSIVVGDEVKEGMHARGMVLYNHFTVFHKDECPSRGDLGIILKVVGSKLIAVASDYYGFGVTGDKNQAYCMSRTNAQNSLDALLAARELLKGLGYEWDDYLFNLGYSEGGQTSIGVLRLCAEKYPNIRFTHTIAGGGPYDIGETYRQLVSSGETTMPSTVISTLLAYNEYYNLGVRNEDMFQEPTLSNIDKYLLSKNYKRSKLDGLLATNKISEWISPALLDFKSSLALKFIEVFERENLSKGWKPLGTERVSLVHNILDGCVPYANMTQQAEFFKQQGFTLTQTSSQKFQDGTVYLFAMPFPSLSENVGAHEVGALNFVIEILSVVGHYLDIAPWFTIDLKDLEDV